MTCAREVRLRLGDLGEPLQVGALSGPLLEVGERAHRLLVRVEVALAEIAAGLEDLLVERADPLERLVGLLLGLVGPAGRIRPFLSPDPGASVWRSA